MVLQFRSVRMLIAQDQLDMLSREVRLSERPMILANAAGRVLLTNEAFEQLLHSGHPSLRMLDDLPQFFSEPIAIRRALDALVQGDRTWRGEIFLESLSGTGRALTVRAEPVYASLERKLGFILQFAELGDRRTAETARRRFQEGMIDYSLLRPERLDPEEDRAFRSMIAPVIENAQLAALEITYGLDVDRMPELLEAVRRSVSRTAGLLEHLLWHAGSEIDSRR
jgi:two-component system, chemotaxis family, sensor kinase Cph1